MPFRESEEYVSGKQCQDTSQYVTATCLIDYQVIFRLRAMK